jgi:hypothetical protein
MTNLYRPTFHQIFALRWREAGWDCARTCVQQAVEHVVALAPAAAADLSTELTNQTPEPAPVVERSDLRYPLVRSTGLYPVPRRPPLFVAFYAYRDGTTLLLHLIWYFDGDAQATTFAEMQRLRWTGPGPDVAGALGEGVLLSAVPMDGTAQAVELAAEMLASFGSPEALLVALPLNDATLCLRRWDPPRREPWRAVLLFDRPEVQQSPAASRLVFEEWPLVVLYRLRLDYLYLTLYCEGVPPQLEQNGQAVQQALDRSVVGAGRPAPACSPPSARGRSSTTWPAWRRRSSRYWRL